MTKDLTRLTRLDTEIRPHMRYLVLSSSLELPPPPLFLSLSAWLATHFLSLVIDVRDIVVTGCRTSKATSIEGIYIGVIVES
jgi:hypothetical protein